MAFDWFRRKFSGAQPAETPAKEAVEAEESSLTEDSGETDPAEDGTSENDDNDAEDESLAWAKAAFANIKRKQSGETDEEADEEADTEAEAEATSTEEAESDDPEAGPETELEAEQAAPESTVAESSAETTAPVSTEAEPPAPESVETEAESSETEAADEAEEQTTAAGADSDEATDSDADEAVASATNATASPAVEAAAAIAEPSIVEEPSPEPEPEPTAAPLGLLARAEAERDERIERMKATAIEEPEPEPEEDDEEEIYSGPRITFDENFIWSAEVLAAQGRAPEDISYEEITWLNKLRQGLGKTRRGLVNQLKAIVGQGPLNDDAVMEIESLLLQADVGVDATDYIIDSLQARLREEALPPAQAIAYLKRLLRDLLDSPIKDDDSIVLAPEKDVLNIWLMTGVNGAGKTTTIGKLAHLAKKSDYRCLIGAADTFRAAAVEQVKVWGERSGIEVIANPGKNTDPAAVVFDAIAAAKSRDTELLLVDTAGRLQNKKNLMAELAKVRRIIDKKAPDAKVESLLVLDSTLGQNGLQQAKVFAEAAELSGVVLTKLDGTARGGVALAVVQQLGLPIRFIGAGEGIGDLRPFSSYEFVEALLSG